MSTVTRAGHALVVLAVVLLVGVFAVQAFPQAVGADESFVVLSGSMEPEISTGDVVIVKSVSPTSVETGDVITYRRSDSGTPVTHRVMAVQETEDGLKFVTKGDANEDADPGHVSATALVGRVTFVIPYVGYVVNFANTDLGKLALIGVPFGILALTETIGIVLSRTRREPKPESAEDPADAASAERTAEGSAADGLEIQSVDGVAGERSPQNESQEDGVSITTTDLRLSGATFLAFAVYAGAMAFQHPGGLTVGVAVAAVCGVLLIGLVYLAGEPDAPGEIHSSGVTDGGVEVPDGDKPNEQGADSR